MQVGLTQVWLSSCRRLQVDDLENALDMQGQKKSENFVVALSEIRFQKQLLPLNFVHSRALRRFA
jgi:hypothetical protein